MKSVLNLVLGCCVLALVACDSAEKTEEPAAGAFGDQPACCSADAAPACCAAQKSEDASPAALSSGTCPYSGN